MAEELSDILSLAQANYWLGLALSYSCKYERALHHIGKTLEMNMAANSLWGVSALKSVISAFVYDFQGRIGLGYQTSDEALRLAEESGDIYSRAWGYTFHGYSCYCKGFLERAEEHLLKGIDFCESVNLRSYVLLGHHWLGHTYFDMGEYGKSQDCFEKAILRLAQEQETVFPSG